MSEKRTQITVTSGLDYPGAIALLDGLPENTDVTVDAEVLEDLLEAAYKAGEAEVRKQYPMQLTWEVAGTKYEGIVRKLALEPLTFTWRPSSIRFGAF